jgi:hypothetical protein
MAEHLDLAAARVQVERREAEQRGLPGTVRAEHDPPLAPVDRPVDAGEDGGGRSDDIDAGQTQCGAGRRGVHDR